MAEDTQDPTRIPGAPHPRETVNLIGQDAAQAAFLDAFNGGRVHHAWLLTGPRGVGKATLAWRIARFLLATPDPDPDDMFGAPVPSTLDVSPDHPVTRRIAAGSDPGLKSVHRTENEKTKRLRDQITIDDIRALGSFFQLSATDGGRRVVIIDAADDMNVNAANALLKMLEEPPARTTLLLICHQPSRLLPTIRSRCRTLRLGTLDLQQMEQAMAQAGVDPGPDATALAELSAGSVGDALRLSLLDGLKIYREVIHLLGTLPNLDRGRALALAEAAAGRGAEEKLDLLYTLIDVALSRLARTGALGHPPPVEAAPDEAAILMRLAPHAHQARAWAQTAQTALARARHGRAVNLDPAALVLDTLFKLSETAPAR
ncbi:DNA polymerase III subunit delta' [Tateyamaria omphalii]|uniref:DNA polymerase III subunit delta' n=1 Tax=Tateyamaria omphalii TaxID=299262 RepID=UPI001C99410E|nr:DNA polymerase III subunit delta' [Tateyamaria omphalii]MBY5934051.1 DNA polymerase III subunit delta' [Tateyamaria omphalii]